MKYLSQAGTQNLLAFAIIFVGLITVLFIKYREDLLTIFKGDKKQGLPNLLDRVKRVEKSVDDHGDEIEDMEKRQTKAEGKIYTLEQQAKQGNVFNVAGGSGGDATSIDKIDQQIGEGATGQIGKNRKDS